MCLILWNLIFVYNARASNDYGEQVASCMLLCYQGGATHSGFGLPNFTSLNSSSALSLTAGAPPVSVPLDDDMIILDEDPPSKPGSYSDILGPTLRYPDRVAGRASTLTLPDYETSQALAFNLPRSTKRRSKGVDARCVVV